MGLPRFWSGESASQRVDVDRVQVFSKIKIDVNILAYAKPFEKKDMEVEQ
jgi:hypothetical protein